MAKTEQQIRERLAANLITLRKQKGLTQQELAEKINYSDKSISKWERAEGIPDLYILDRLSEIYGVSLNDFLADENQRPTLKQEIAPLSWRSKAIITALAVGLVCLFATIVYFVLHLVGLDSKYLILAYYCAIPVSSIVLVVFTSLWFKKLWSFLSITLLIWSTAFGVYLFIPASASVFIFEVAAVLEILLILWYVLLKVRSREKKEKKKQKN